MVEIIKAVVGVVVGQIIGMDMNKISPLGMKTKARKEREKFSLKLFKAKVKRLKMKVG